MSDSASIAGRYLIYIGSVRRYSARTVAIYREVLTSFAEYCTDASGPGTEGSSAAGGASETDSADAFTGPGPELMTVSNVRNYEVHLLSESGNSPRTVNLHLSVLSGFCRFLMREGLIAGNPVHLVTRPKEPKRLPTFYREEAVKSYFEQTAHDADREALDFLLSLPPGDKTAEKLYSRRLSRLIISILVNTGLRRSELISLDRNNIDFRRRTLRVTGKGGKMREIPLIPVLCEEISLYLSAADSMLKGVETGQTPLLRTLKGDRPYPVFIDRTVKNELGTAGGFTGRKSPHVLRHTLASELLDHGSDLNSIKELLGHSSLAATQVYTHNTIERLKKVYNNAHPRAKNDCKNGD